MSTSSSVWPVCCRTITLVNDEFTTCLPICKYSLELIALVSFNVCTAHARYLSASFVIGVHLFIDEIFINNNGVFFFRCHKTSSLHPSERACVL